MTLDLDWRRLLDEQQGEHRNVDFKAASSWAGEDRAKLTADILAMSNTPGGGLLIVGVAENAAKRLELPGLDDAQVRSFDTTDVASFVNQYAEPQARLTVEKPIVEGHAIVLVRVEEFSETPLIATRALDYTDRSGKQRTAFPAGAVLIRTKAAQTTVIKSAEDMRDLVKRAVLKSKDDLLLGFRQLLESEARAPVIERAKHEQEQERWSRSFGAWAATLPNDAIIVISALPEKDLSATAPDLKNLKAVLHAADSHEHGFEFLGTRYVKETNLVGAVEGQLGDYILWQAHLSGAFFYATSLEDRHGPTKVGSLWLWRPVDHVSLALRFFAQYFTALAFDGELNITVTMKSVKDRRLDDNGQEHFPPWVVPICREETFTIPLRTTAPKLVAGWELDAAKTIGQLLEVFNLEMGEDFSKRLVARIPGARPRAGGR
jgi:hypothetical protein